MEKRTLLAFVLIIIFFSIWSRIGQNQVVQPTDKEEVRTEQKKETPHQLPDSLASGQVPAVEIAPAPDLIRETSINGYQITYSLQGGYLVTITPPAQQEPLPFSNIGFEADRAHQPYQAAVKGNSLIFTAPGQSPKKFNFQGQQIQISGLSGQVLNLFTLNLNTTISGLDKRYFEVFYQEDGQIQRQHPSKAKLQPLAAVDFGGARSKYHVASLMPGSYNLQWQKNEQKISLYLLNPKPTVTFYLGPQTQEKLSRYGLEGIIYYGFWHFLALFLIKALYFFYHIFSNWGLSIIALGISAYLLLFPLTAKSTKAMKKMQDLQPLMQEIKEKYKDKPQKMQKETVKLYKEHRINPLGGCLPLLFQAPIFIAFYQVVFRFPELHGASFLWIKDLSAPDRFLTLPFSLPFMGANINILPVFLAILGIIQQQVTTGSANPQQKKMGLFMGVFMGVIFYNFPAALVIYFLVQNTLTLTYQIRLRKVRSLAK